MSEPKAQYDSEHAPQAAKSSALEMALRKLEKARSALKQYADRKNWARSICEVSDKEDWWGPNSNGYELAETALKELDDA